jgi:hypothetical protein
MDGPCGTHREWRGAYGSWVDKFEGKTPLGRPSHTWQVILKWIFKKYDGIVLGLIWLGMETSGGLS